jgi:secondary thiamine-phosphate synthase enzyme
MPAVAGLGGQRRVERLIVRTQHPKEWINITVRVGDTVPHLGLVEGAVLIFSPHTTASITVNEAWDPAVADDCLRALDDLLPDDWPSYLHAEGNSAAHLKTTLVGSSVLVPVVAGRLQVGRWQGIFLCEFDGPRDREVWVTAVRG